MLVIDDHELFRSGFELLISQCFPCVDVRIAAGVGEAIDSCPEAPDFILLDYNLIGVSRDAAIALIRGLWPSAQLIVVTAEQDQETLDKIGTDKGLRLLPKSASLEEFSAIVGACLPSADLRAGAELHLSERQIEILWHIREGRSNKAIARLLDLSEFTVRGHVQRILKLTGATNRTSAVFLAEQAGVLGNGRKPGGMMQAGTQGS